MFEALAGEIVRDCQRGALPANVALMRLVMASSSPDQIELFLFGGTAPAVLRAMWRRHPDFWALAKSMQATVDHRASTSGSVEERARAVALAFDRAASLSPDGASALYGLADPELLNAATAEVVEYLAALNLLSPHARVLDIGCGAGRLEIALAARVERVVGLEASAAMASAARRRCCDLANVEIAVCEGGVPPALDDASFDLAIAVDAFPYILQSGDALAARWFDAVGRALPPEGDFVILNYSYRGDLSRDIEQAAEFGRERSMRPLALGAAPFRHWDGVAFHFKKGLSPASAGTSPSRRR